jgi:hypothetical protein
MNSTDERRKRMLEELTKKPEPAPQPEAPAAEPRKSAMPQLTPEESARVADETGKYLKMPEVQRAQALQKAANSQPASDKIQ